MRFNDYVGELPPQSTVSHLQRVGGGNQKGQPIYRLVQADRVLEKIGASWEDYAENIPVADRGTIVTGADGGPAVAVRPLRTVVEVREVQRYPNLPEGSWVLERFMPAALYGTELAWYSIRNCVPGTGVPLLGPYPEGGRYEMIGGPYPQMPGSNFLSDQVAFWEARRAEIPRDVEKHVRQKTYEGQRREEERRRKARAEKSAEIFDALTPIASNSLTAGAWRTKLAERGGFRSHIGN